MSRDPYERVEEIGGFKYITLKSGRRFSFYDAISGIDAAHTSFATAASRAFKLMRDNEYDLEDIERKVDRLEEYLGVVRHEIKKRKARAAKLEQIAALRVTKGRTPEEAREFLAKADELEKKLDSP